jgi:hypothetical protein
MAAPPRSPQQRKRDTLHRLQQDVDAWVATSWDGELPRSPGAHRGGRIELVDDEGADRVPLGVGNILRPGDAATVVAISGSVTEAVKAASALSLEGVLADDPAPSTVVRA